MDVRRMTRAIGWVTAVAGSAIGPGGCVGPLGPKESDYGDRVPRERLREVDRLRLEEFARPSADPEGETEETIEGRGSRFEGMERVELSIEEARASALENNLDLDVALIDPTIAGQTLREEEAKFEAVFTPRLLFRENDDPAFDVTASNQSDFISGGLGVSVPLRTGGRATVELGESRTESDNPFFTFNTAYDADLTLSLSQPLLRNAGRRANTYTIRVASYEEQIAQARTKLEVIRQLAAVDRSYWRLYAARRELEVRQTQYELATAQLGRAERRVRAGDVAEVEALRAESGVAERLEAIILAENDVLAQQRELKRIVNAPGLDIGTASVIVPATEPDPVPYRFDGSALSAVGVDNRMEMLELELQLAADAAGIEFNRNQALPLLTLDYTYRISGLDDTFRGANEALVENDFESWSVGLSGEIPIGNEAAKARVQRSILTRLQRLSTREARALAIRQEVLDAVDRVEAGWQRILAARQAALAAARTFRAEERQNEVGTRTSTDVLDAAARLAEAQSAEIRALADYQIALVDLAFATGTLLGSGKVEWEPASGEVTEFTPPAAEGDEGEGGEVVPVETEETPEGEGALTPPEGGGETVERE